MSVSYYQWLQIESLKAALRFLRAENSRLKAHRAYVSASSLFDPSDPLMRRANTRNRPTSTTPSPSSPSPHGGEQEQDKEVDSDEPADVIRSLAMDARLLLRDVRAATAAPKVVDITRAPGPGAKEGRKKRWSSIREDPIWQIREREERDEELRKRGEELWERVKRVKGVMSRGGMAFGGEEITFEKEKVELLGRVTVPVVGSLNGRAKRTGGYEGPGKRCLVVKKEEFERIHGVFVA